MATPEGKIVSVASSFFVSHKGIGTEENYRFQFGDHERRSLASVEMRKMIGIMDLLNENWLQGQGKVIPVSGTFLPKTNFPAVDRQKMREEIVAGRVRGKMCILGWEGEKTKKRRVNVDGIGFWEYPFNLTIVQQIQSADGPFLYQVTEDREGTFGEQQTVASLAIIDDGLNEIALIVQAAGPRIARTLQL